MRYFASVKLGEFAKAAWGAYYHKHNALVLHENGGFGSIGHALMYPIWESKLVHAPVWAKLGVSTLFEKIYGYKNNNEMEIKFGYHNPWRIKEIGDATQLRLSDLVLADASEISQSQARLVMMFVLQKGVFSKYIDALLTNTKGGFGTYIEFAFNQDMGTLEKYWAEYVSNIMKNREQILAIPNSRLFKTEADFLAATSRFLVL